MDYTYHGDVNIKYGGMYLNLEESDDYIPVVKITDLDSGCGFEGAILIEQGSIYIPTDHEKRQDALSCCGWEDEKEITPLMLAIVFDAYGGIESEWDGAIVIQTEKGGPMQYDGWKADSYWTRKYHASRYKKDKLKKFIENNFVN
jgi:hypothetical protein